MTLILSFNDRIKMIHEAIKKHKEIYTSNHPWYSIEQTRLKELSEKYDLESIEKNNPFLIFYVYAHLKDDIRYPEWIHKKLDFYLTHKLEEKSEQIESLCRNHIEKSQKKLDDFLALDVSTPRTNIDDSYYNGVYHFFDVRDNIENAWKFRSVNFFCEDFSKKAVAEIFKVTPEQIEIGYKESPLSGGIIANALSFFQIYNGWGNSGIPEMIPYVNHWHYINNQDFKDTHNGRKCWMLSKPHPNEPKLFQKIREIYALECKKENHNGQESIPFYLEW